jgi:5'-3' exonuclease
MRINNLSHDLSISDSVTTPVRYHNLVPHQPRLFLIDSFGFIFRAYHARARTSAPPMRTSAGLSTEAVYIFNNMLRKLGKSYAPEYIAAVFESGAPVARMAEFAAKLEAARHAAQAPVHEAAIPG